MLLPTTASSLEFSTTNWPGCIETRISPFLIKNPIFSNSVLNLSCHGSLLNGWEAKGTRSEVILKKRSPEAAFKERISERHLRFEMTVAMKRSAEKEASRNVLELRHERERLMHGYPRRILELYPFLNQNRGKL